MLLDKIIEFQINSNNKKYYSELLNSKLENKDIISISQKLISPKSHMKLECQCDICGVIFTRARKDIRENTLCSKECRNKNIINPNPSKPKNIVKCEICNVSVEVVDSKLKKQKYFTCSRKCYSEHRKIKYNKDNIYNYQNKIANCKTCNLELKTSNWYINNKNNLFCSKECYWQHRKDDYLNSYYQPSIHKNRKETNPEKMVRLFLEKNNIIFEQEKPMNRYFLDFYLPEYNIAIEVYGDYWHANPEIYGNDKKEINNNQLKTINKDIKRNELLMKNLESIIILWESDINRDLESLMNETLLNKIVNKNP